MPPRAGEAQQLMKWPQFIWVACYRKPLTGSITESFAPLPGREQPARAHTPPYFSQFYWGIIDVQPFLVLGIRHDNLILRNNYTVVWSTSVPSHGLQIFLVMRTSQVYSLRSLQIYNTVLLSVVTVPHVMFPGLLRWGGSTF